MPAEGKAQNSAVKDLRLGACGSCRILRQITAKFSDLWAPLGVCKVENAQKLCFFAFFSIKKGKARQTPRRFFYESAEGYSFKKIKTTEITEF